jgi:hypothetical protein
MYLYDSNTPLLTVGWTFVLESLNSERPRKMVFVKELKYFTALKLYFKFIFNCSLQQVHTTAQTKLTIKHFHHFLTAVGSEARHRRSVRQA